MVSVPVPARPKQLCWGRKKLPDVHQVGLLFSIPLHSLCFLRDLLEHDSAARVNLWSATAHLQVFYGSICKVKQAIFIQVDLPPPWPTQQQSNSLKKQTAMREYIQPCMNTTVNIKKDVGRNKPRKWGNILDTGNTTTSYGSKLMRAADCLFCLCQRRQD